jgi:hypothetical protein
VLCCVLSAVVCGVVRCAVLCGAVHAFVQLSARQERHNWSGDVRGYAECIAEVILALANDWPVDGQDQRLKSCSLCVGDHFASEFAVFHDIALKPLRHVRSGTRHVAQRVRRGGGQDQRSAERIGGARTAELAGRVREFLHTPRGQSDGHGHATAQH